LADNVWSYHQESDSLTNQTYSLAQSPLPQPGLYDDMMLEIVCKENKLQAVIDTNDLIASQSSRFSLEYQIDKKHRYDSNENIPGLQAQGLYRRICQTHGG